MRRRDFITLVGSAMSWPLAVRAQPGERIRLIGILAAQAQDDPDMRARLAAFRKGLEKLGWLEDRNIHIETRFAAGRADQFEVFARELVALKPDVILAHTTPVVAALRRESRAIPIAFISVSDPIGSGFVASLGRPGGNVTGVLQYEASIAGKWLAMLKEIAPGVVRAALLANPKTTAFDYFRRSAEAVAPSLAIEVVPSPVETATDIERVMGAFAGVANGGLILPPDSTTLSHRNLVISLANQYRLPAVYSLRAYVAAGGLISYDTNQAELARLAATYIDRILRGASPAELPVQAPTKYETVLNLKTAKALGLTVPPGLLVAADEVIE